MTDSPQREQPRGTVLVVDDDSDMLNLLRKWVESAGFKVTTAASGSEALGHLAARAAWTFSGFATPNSSALA